VAEQLRFIHDGFQEISRKIRRRKLRSRLAALEKQRKEALSQLGRRSWEAKVDLAGYGDLRDQLLRLDDRAGQLTARTNELQAQSTSLQSRRTAEVARFDQLSRPVQQQKTETDTGLRTARARLSESERTIGSLQARLKWLSDELTRSEQASSGQPAREPLLGEQKSVSDQLAAAAPARETLATEVARLAGESQRLSQQLAGIEAERKAALSPIDTELQRIKQESQGATREISNVGREQTDRFADLGAALYGRKVAHPALEECTGAIQAIDNSRSEAQSALDASLALSGAMPRWTMLKFTAVPVILVLIAIVGLSALYYLSSESPESGPLQYIARHIPGVGPKESADGSVSSEESRKDEIVQAFFRAPDEESRRRQAVEILESDLMTVGSTADRAYLPYLLKILRRGEPELRAAAGHSIGMIGPSASELPVLIEALNDPVRGVRDGALAALEQLQEVSAVRLLVRRVHGARATGRRNWEPFAAEPVPDLKSRGVPIYEGATFLHFASDPEIGRSSFSTDASVQNVLDFYKSRSGRPALRSDEFSRLYFGSTPADPTGAKRLASEFESFFREAMQSGKPEAQIKAERDKRAARMQNLPAIRYQDYDLYSSPSFVALEDARPAGTQRPIRYVAVFEDRAVGKTVFEVYAEQ